MTLKIQEIWDCINETNVCSFNLHVGEVKSVGESVGATIWSSLENQCHR